MTRPGRDVRTIKCEACQGRGWHYTGTIVGGFEETENCELCSASGRESTDVQARHAVEGRPEEDDGT